MAVPSIAIADGDAACHIQGRKQRRYSVPFVIMRLSRRYTWCQGQNRLGPVQRLHLTLFVHTKDDRTIRRMHVQADDISHFLNELRVFGELEVLHAMRLQSEGTPDPHDSRLR